MLNRVRPVMSTFRVSIALSFFMVAAGGGVGRDAHAQSAAARADGAVQEGCVSASGPDTGPSTLDGASLRARTAAAAAKGADVVLLASMSADEVRFASQPKICVRLRGDVRLDSVRVVGRRNIASPVVSGTSYRNVHVAVEILGHLNAECIAARITRETAPKGLDCASLDVRSGAAPSTRHDTTSTPVPPRR